MAKAEISNKEEGQEEEEAEAEAKAGGEEEKEECSSPEPWKMKSKQRNQKHLALACMLNTEVGAVLAVIRRSPDHQNSHFLPSQEDVFDPPLLNSLKYLRSFIFSLQQEWRTVDPLTYLSPFLDVIQSDDIPASATGVALSAVLKILKLEIFDEKTPGARNAVNSVVLGLTNCRLERTDPFAEDAVMMRILQVLTTIMKNPSSFLLTGDSVQAIVNSCFQVVQQSASRTDLLQRHAKHTMHELIQLIFSRLPDVEAIEGAESGVEDDDSIGRSGYGARCMVDIFQFLCNLMNGAEGTEIDGMTAVTDDEVQLFAMTLINSAIELGGEAIGKHSKLLKMIQDDLFYYLIQFGVCSNPLVLSMICSTVLNLYNSLRGSLRLQLEAFFTFVLFRIAANSNSPQLQEVAMEGIINFCRQPSFVIEAYVNYDCDPICRNVFEDIGKLICRNAYTVTSSLSSNQIQAFEGLVTIIYTIVDNMIVKQADLATGTIELTEYKPFWVERCKNFNDSETWVEFVRTRKQQKKKILMAANHFNRDVKKGLDYLKICHLVPDPPDSKSIAYFYKYAPGLDKKKIGDYLGEPDEFHVQVLKEYTDTFDFTGAILDTALRTFLETFRLPGESQKIQRILEAFSEKFYEQQSSEMFASKDAVFIFCYSLIMLNTDQHNPQVKKKMTEEEFIRNNRSINGGKDLPREYLSELFHSILNNAISLFRQKGATMEMTPNLWADLINRTSSVEPFMLCSWEPLICREMFVAISGPSVAALSAIFEQADDDEILQESIEGLISIAQIASHGLEDILDELLACLCKFTGLFNPYISTEESIFAFSNDLKPKMAILSLFTIAHKFRESIRGGWKNIVDCLLKLKRLKLLPRSVLELDTPSTTSNEYLKHYQSETCVILPSFHSGFGSTHPVSSMMCRFSQLLSLDSTEDSSANAGNDFEQNLMIIRQCGIGNIFLESSDLPIECLQNLGRALIFAAAGKGHKVSPPTEEEEEAVGLCWELLVLITSIHIEQFPIFWPTFHDYLVRVTQFPFFSPCPFTEKAIVGLLKICQKLLDSSQSNCHNQELIFDSVNVVWKLEKEVLDTCCESITEIISRIIIECRNNIQSPLGWRMLLHFLTFTACHPETNDQGVEALMSLLSDEYSLNKFNYSICIECAFRFATHEVSPLEKGMKLVQLMEDSVKLLVQWHCLGNSDTSSISNTSSSSAEGFSKANTNSPLSMFMTVADALRKTCLDPREEIRNQSVLSLSNIFLLAKELDFSPATWVSCFNNIFFITIDDLYERMVKYSRRTNSEKEMKSMEGTLMLAMKLLVRAFLKLLMPLSRSQDFKQLWLGFLRRMDAFMKGDFGVSHDTQLQILVPELLKEIITEMKETRVLVQGEGDELWQITNIQVQWIAPSVKQELFPEQEEY
ncbi:ARF guanine-nucleotide exchange factor GNL2-like [Aristolochia californica]|uniref:ARF guanine-nucleotide exchange factor GNL2-like n=1 Tax=Aristolochia californica TaxID=171875 RepID=UPI0035E18BC3